MAWKELRTRLDTELKAKFVPVLRANGFKGSYPHFRRLRNDRLDVLGLQFSLWSPALYFEIGISPKEGTTFSDGKHYPPKSIKFYQTHHRERVGKPVFDYEHTSPDIVAQELIDALKDAEKWWSENDI